MTALWEAAMRRIAGGEMPLAVFLNAVVKQLGELVASGCALGVLRVPLGTVTERPRRPIPTGRPLRRSRGAKAKTTVSQRGT
jgi:hypothetical protein